MRGYTPWRVEEVGKLHYDVKIRTMTDSKVRIDDILQEVLDILTDHDTQEHFDQGSGYDTDFPSKWPKAPELSGFRPFMEDFYRQCGDGSLTLIKALEVAWGIENGSLVARCVPAQQISDLLSIRQPQSTKCNRAVQAVLRHIPILVPSHCCSKTALVA